MKLIEWIWDEALSYGLLAWLCFVFIAFVGARFGRFWGVIASGIVVGIAVIVLDFNWVFDEMRNHPEDGKDLDGPFLIITVFRAAVINTVLLPVSAVGLLLSSRNGKKRPTPQGGANGERPGRSNSIQDSLAAAPRRSP